METCYLQAVLKSQYHAGMRMLGDALVRCPGELWADAGYPNQFWHIAECATWQTPA